ncbi:MAG: hypothetical protein IJ073_08335 [Lachnospiraceae bacterium]|nr:hypothetical protein [Lachnospiraceae bacterium]
MLAVKETELYNGDVVADFMKKVYAGETLEVSGANDKKAIVIPIGTYNELQEERKKNEFWDEISRRFQEVKNGAPLVRKTIEELEAMENE